MKVTEVTWIDACSEDAMIDVTYIENMLPMERKNVGYIIRETEEYLILVSGNIFNVEKGIELYDHTLLIPKRMVKDVKATRPR